MLEPTLASRLSRLPTVEVLGRWVPVAVGLRARLFGLARLDREEAGAGLLFPHCSSVHTFGMRFALDLHFLDRHGREIKVRHELRPRRLAFCRGAVSVLEVPSENERARR